MRETGERNGIVVLAVGDVMLGEHPLYIGHGVLSAIRRSSHDQLFSHVREVLSSADFAFGNLEAPLCRETENSGLLQSRQLRGDPDGARLLANAGFNVVSLANNHFGDHGEAAMRETILVLAANRIHAAGATLKPAPLVLRKGDLRIGFLAFDLSGMRDPAEEAALLESVRRTRKGVDIVIVSVHWGDEFIDLPSLAQVALGHAMVDHGADLIIGHHPHVLQGTEEYRGGLIAYSLGNFVFDMHHRRSKQTAVLRAELAPDRPVQWAVLPASINRQRQPVLLRGRKRRRAERRIAALSARIGVEVSPEQYQRKLRRTRTLIRISRILYFVSHCLAYPPGIARQILLSSARVERRVRIDRGDAESADGG